MKAIEEWCEENDIVLLDIGCKYKGLSSDMTRTVFIGKPTAKMKEVYQLVLEANNKAEETAIKGVHVAVVDAAARNIISEAGYGDYFTTRLGHGIGYSTHEAPDIKQSSDRKLDNGMAFSIELGAKTPLDYDAQTQELISRQARLAFPIKGGIPIMVAEEARRIERL